MKHRTPLSSPDERAAPLPATVAEIGQIHFEGNIIPHPWYQRITLASGKPDLPAIIILAEIVYWYRPYQTLDKGGKPILRKHFDGDMFQCSAAYFETKFGLTKTQARRAITRLEDGGLIRREFRNVVIQGILRNNITFIEPVPPAIMAITHPSTTVTEMVSAANETPMLPSQTPSPVGETLSPVGETPSPVGEGLSLRSHLSEITTETTTEITTTTPNPSSAIERAAEPEPARGGSGIEDQNPDPDGDQGVAVLESGEENPVSREEPEPAPTDQEFINTPPEPQKTVASERGIEARRPELAFPAKLTEQEYEDIAAQVYPLPPEVAQQMLDAVQAKIQAGHVKTNPAALLRGIVRKYRADPASFDPSSGFQIAEARRRRVEAEARARAEAEQRAREREALRNAAPGAAALRRQSIESMRQALRGH